MTNPPLPLRKIFLLAIAIGVLCFFVNNLSVWSAALSPAPGHQARWVLSNMDVPIYLTWMTLAPKHWLLPNYNAPWTSDDALVSPLVLVAGKFSSSVGLSPRAGFQIFHLFFYIVAAFAFAAVLYSFCTTRRQRIAATIASVAALPLPLLALGWADLVGKQIPILWLGLIQFSYDTADGLFRGGTSNSYTLSFGTAANLAGLFFLTRYVRGGQRRDVVLLALTAVLSALFHPVEMCVIVLASIATFGIQAYRNRNSRTGITNATLVVAGALLGLLPYLIQTSRSQWVRDISRLYVWEAFSILWVPLVFGIPTVLAIYFLLMRYRLTTPGDEVLRTWFFASFALLYVPGVPMKLHIFDGFPYITAILLVRLLSSHQPLRNLIERKPSLPLAVAAAALAICLPGYVSMYKQLWNDGRKEDPQLLLNALQRTEEPQLLAWFRSHEINGQLAMGPLDIAPWLATVPMPSLASHDLFGVTYEDQNRFVSRFYQGRLSDEDASRQLRDYGVHYLVIPTQGPSRRYVTDQTPIAQVGVWSIYERKDAVLKSYPGLAALRPDVAQQSGLAAWLVKARDLFAR